jgi:hypothetical protein
MTNTPPTCILKKSGVTNEEFQSKKIAKHVDFDCCIVYEFNLLLGDNPSVKEGCPVALGTECVNKSEFDIDVFEFVRKPRRRSTKELHLSVQQRASM